MNPLNRLSIRSKFIILMLIVSITSIIAIGLIGNRSGEKILKSSVSQELKALKHVKAGQIESYFKDIENNMKMLSSNKMVIDSLREFIISYNLTKYNALDKEQTTQLKSYYEKEFIPVLEKQSNAKVSIENILPKTISAHYLQYHYIINNKMSEKEEMIKADDKSSYSDTHQKYHRSMQNICDKLSFEDLFFIESDSGDIVYSVKKEVDFATNLIAGVHRRSNLAALSKILGNSVEKNVIHMIDYETYLPSFNKPAAFIGISIYDENEYLGLLVVKLSSNKINEILTSNYDWESVGLGESGDVFLVGRDYKMRSNNRYMRQSPDIYKKMLISANIPKQTIDSIFQNKNTLMHLSVKTDAVIQAQQGASKTIVTRNYLGHEVLSSFAPLKLGFVNWVIVAEKNLEEANKVIIGFREKFAISTIVLIFLVTLFAMFSARVFTKPINSLIDGIRRVDKGDTQTKVMVNSTDEFNDLADSFNAMVKNLNRQEKQIKNKDEKINTLLVNMMPESIAKRYLSGEKNIVEHHDSVTVIFTALTGFSEIEEKNSPDVAFSLLNNLIESFDDAADELGVEKIKTIGDDYLAACGLSIPRFDHGKKAVDFAIEILAIIERFNSENSANISIKIGLDSGYVSEGLIGKIKFEYNIWGDTVDISSHLRYKAELNSIRITQSVYESLDKKEDFLICPIITSKNFGEVINYQYQHCSEDRRSV